MKTTFSRGLLRGTATTTALTAGVLAGVLLPAPAANAAVAGLNCLVINGTTAGKAGVCAELNNTSAGWSTYGRFGGTNAATAASLTVTVEFHPATAPLGSYTVLARQTVNGKGQVNAATPAVRPTGAGLVRACATAVISGNSTPYTACTASVLG